MTYLVDPNNLSAKASADCLIYCGIKPCYGIPPEYPI